MRTNTPKRAAQERAYRRLRLVYLETHPDCERCGEPATEIHHRRGRVGELLCRAAYFMAACHRCHEFITQNPLYAYEHGYSERRVGAA